MNSEEESKYSKTKDCWFEFQACLSDAFGNVKHLDFIHKEIIAMRKHMKDSNNAGNPDLGKNTIEDYLCSQEVEEIAILPLNNSNYKVYRKRIVGAVEKSLGGKKMEEKRMQDMS